MQDYRGMTKGEPPHLASSHEKIEIIPSPWTSILSLAYVVENNFRGGIPIVVVIRSTVVMMSAENGGLYQDL